MMGNKKIDHGIVFYPIKKFAIKLIAWAITLVTLISVGIITLFAFIGAIADNKESSDFNRWIVSNGSSLLAWYLFFCLIMLIITSIAIIYYVQAIEYEINDREIIVRKGLINKEEKHIPFRTITNVSSRYGIYDRIFGIGTVEIETAGKSGQQMGPEAKIEGIENFIKIRDVILENLRKFRGQYATTTEQNTPSGELAKDNNYLTYQKAILTELKEIKNLLAKV
ncbi:MAG: PH domain-containing protein [Candidatus Hodarchaeales archaeon]